jgi:uncharacterized membrane protein
LREFYLKSYVGVLLAAALMLAASWAYWHGMVLEAHLAVGTVVLAVLVLLGDVCASAKRALSASGTWA